MNFPLTHARPSTNAGSYQDNKKNLEKIIVLFLISMILGALTAGILLEHFFHTAYLQFKEDSGLIISIGNPKNSLLLYYLFLHARVFFLLVFFSFTNVWKLYSRFFLCYTGMIQGILFAFCIRQNHVFPGLLEYICFSFPHALVLIPLYLYCYLSFQRLHDKFFLTGSKRQKRELLFMQLPIYLSGILILLLGSFLEAYINLPLLQKLLHTITP